MSILDIRAFCQCDGCAKRLTVQVDPASKTNEALPSPFDVVEDMVRGGSACRDDDGMTSVQAGKMLCSDCTRRCDNFLEEDRDLTPDEVQAALSSDQGKSD